MQNNLRRLKLATWEDPSTPFHFGRDDMSVGGSVQPHGLYLQRGGRQICRPYRRNTIQPHVIYSQRPRNGTQAVPYGFADWCIFEPTYSKNGHVRRPNNCQLSMPIKS